MNLKHFSESFWGQIVIGLVVGGSFGVAILLVKWLFV